MEKSIKTPVEYGIEVCEALIKRYKPQELPPVGTFFYHQGVALSGMQQIYFLTEDKRYFNYIKEYVDSVIGENGELYGFNHEMTTDETPWLTWNALTMLDHKQPSIQTANVGLGIPFAERDHVVGIEDSGAGVCSVRLAGFTT